MNEQPLYEIRRDNGNTELVKPCPRCGTVTDMPFHTCQSKPTYDTPTPRTDAKLEGERRNPRVSGLGDWPEFARNMERKLTERIASEVDNLEAALLTLGRLRARYDSEFSPPMESDSKVAESAVRRLLHEEQRRASTGEPQ